MIRSCRWQAAKAWSTSPLRSSTVHKAQGMTCDRAFLLATDDLYQELGYVALSRGRLGNHIVTVGGLEHDLESPAHAPTIERRAEVLGASVPQGAARRRACS